MPRTTRAVLANTRRPLAIALTTLLAAPLASAAGSTPTLEEMWQLIQTQNREIAELRSELASSRSQIQETAVQAEVAVSAIESLQSVATSSANKTHIGGYGELHYNQLSKADGGRKDQIDFHRFVLYANHQFSDSLRLVSELELEHSIAGDGQPGEIELEQAYIEWDYAPRQQAKLGLFLIPVGMTNETHEPETFYGVERNNVEKNIIPTTWWEGGAMLSGRWGEGFSYDAGVHSGLFLDPAADTYKVRSGRQKVGEANATDFAYTGRLRYTGVPGLSLSVSAQYQTDLFQGELHADSGAADISATLIEGNFSWQRGDFGLRGLYAQWDIDSAINQIKAGADQQSGYFIEPSYQLNDKLGLFARYSAWDNLAGSSASDSETTQWDIGLNYYLHPRVVIKADYQNQDAASGAQDGLNVGVGYSF